MAAAVFLASVAGSVVGAQQPPQHPPQQSPRQPPRPATRRLDVHFVPTPGEVVDRMLAVARVGPDDRLFDLGSGDGRIVITAAKRFGTRGVGIDIDPQRVAESRRNADTAGVARRVEFRQANLFETDLRQATVVTLYLLPELNLRLLPKLFAELRPGARIVSHAFHMGDWESDSTFEVDGRTVYYWVMPADLAGTWTLTTTRGGVERRYELRLEQRYQRVTGTARAAGREVMLRDVRVRGDSVSFTIAEPGATRPMVLAGRVERDRITGSGAGSGTRAASWRATRTGRR